MESLENHLVDRENGIIKLLDPPFEKGKLEPGYIKAYLPGVRENGGQYTHASCWVIIAESLLGFGDKALELYRMINPIEHARTKEASNKYKVEPYVIPADIYGASNLSRKRWMDMVYRICKLVLQSRNRIYIRIKNRKRIYENRTLYSKRMERIPNTI